MRKTFTLIVIAILTSLIKINAQPVYNSGFEDLNYDGTLSNWGNVYLESGWLDSLGNYHSDSIAYDGQYYYYGPSNDAYSGYTALELRNSWNFTSNHGRAGAVGNDDDSVFSSYGILNLVPTYATPFNQFAPFNFGFYYKFFPVNGDSAYATIALWDSSGNQLGEGTIIITAATNTYTLISAPIIYTMSGTVDFYSMSIHNFYTAEYGSHEPSFGTRLLVDQIDFNFASISSAHSIDDEKHFSIFPNPAKNFINVNFNSKENIPFRIFSVNGKLLKEGIIDHTNKRIGLDNLENGFYFLEVDGEESTMRSFVLNR